MSRMLQRAAFALAIGSTFADSFCLAQTNARPSNAGPPNAGQGVPGQSRPVIQPGQSAAGPARVQPGQAQVQPAQAPINRDGQPDAGLAPAPLDPHLEQLLLNWSRESAKIVRLRGVHHRIVKDLVFHESKHADGVFYYEAPDKGRIDLKPCDVSKILGPPPVDPKTNEAFKRSSDKAERWICDGKQVRQIRDDEKNVEIFAIPPQGQGANIMDGPLPFLFGMPPEKARQRYQMTLESVNAAHGHAIIGVKPLWVLDAQNWSSAKIWLNTKDYLPISVKLIDPGEKLETIYNFAQLEVNPTPNVLVKLFLGEEDPFNPKIPREFKIVAHNVAPPAQNAMPTVIGLYYKDVDEMFKQGRLQALGCKVEFVKGSVAPNAKLLFTVESQDPPVGAQLEKQQVIKLVLFTKPAVAGQADAANRR